MVSKVSSKFVAPEPDGLGIKSGDADKVRDGGGVRVVGKGCNIPAALRFTHAREQEIDLMVVARTRGVRATLAGATRAAMYHWFRLDCHLTPFPDRGKYIRVRNLFFYDPLVPIKG